MKKYLLQTLNLDDYKILEDEVSGGTRPRFILKNTKNNHKFFVKSYAKNPREVWVEVFASILGSKIEGFIEVQQARLKKIPDSFLKSLKEMSTNNELKPLVTFSDYVFPIGFDIKYGHRVVGKNPRDNVSMKESSR